MDIIDALNIPKQEGGIEKDYEWNDDVYYDVPNVVGMTVKEATKALDLFQVEYSGEGDKVIDQSPGAGERIPSGSTVRLLLGS